MLSGCFENTMNHLRQPQETLLRRKTLKALYCSAFKHTKIEFLAIFALFSPYFRTTINIPYNKKTQNPLYFPRFKALTFFSIKTDNALILYIFISLVYLKISLSIPLFFPFTLKKGLPESLIK